MPTWRMSWQKLLVEARCPPQSVSEAHERRNAARASQDLATVEVSEFPLRASVFPFAINDCSTNPRARDW